MRQVVREPTSATHVGSCRCGAVRIAATCVPSGAKLTRRTASCASIAAPSLLPSSDPPEPTSAHERYQQRAGSRSPRSSRRVVAASRSWHRARKPCGGSRRQSSAKSACCTSAEAPTRGVAHTPRGWVLQHRLSESWKWHPRPCTMVLVRNLGRGILISSGLRKSLRGLRKPPEEASGSAQRPTVPT
jgi:hypothetical protein